MNTLKRPGNLYYTCVHKDLHNSVWLFEVGIFRVGLFAMAAAIPHLNSVSLNRADGFFTNNGNNKLLHPASASGRMPLSRVSVKHKPKLQRSLSLLMLSIPPTLWATKWFRGSCNQTNSITPLPTFSPGPGEHRFRQTPWITKRESPKVRCW